MERSVTRRLNYTQRLDIPSAGIEIDVRPMAGAPPRLVLLKFELPAGDPHSKEEWQAARVIFEAWRSDAGAYARFELGRVADVQRRSPPLLSQHLPGFPDEHGISFRIKVVSPQARILAEADRLTASADSRHKDELIRVLPRDLEELPWTIDWSDTDEGPCIHVNKRMYDHQTFLTRDPVTTGLVLPAVLREVLYRVAIDPEARETAWARRWVDFASRVSDTPFPDDKEESAVDAWVLSALHGFSRRHQLATHVDDHMKQSPEETVR